MRSWVQGVFVALISSALPFAHSPAEAKSKAFFRTKGKQVCVGGGCSNAPKAVTKVVDRVTDSDIGKIAGNVARESGIGLGNLERETRRVGGQVGTQLKRSQEDMGEMGTSIYRFMLHQGESAGGILNKFEERFREGKFVDAFWHLATQKLQETEKNAAEAAMESEVLGTVGSVAAGVYGGPGGASGYAAWLTYHKTCAAGKCNPDLALKVGLIAGATNAGNAAAANVTDPLKRAALTGAIAGTAVAASGGKPAAINDAIFRAGASVIVQEGYRQYVGRDMIQESKPAFGEPLCMGMNPSMIGPSQCPNGHAPAWMKKNGNYLMQDENKQWHEVPEGQISKVPPSWKLVGDASATPPGTPVVGIQTNSLPPPNAAYEGSQFMTAVAKVPGMNGMALFHDRWTVNWAMTSDAAVVGSIPVAMVITYTGDTLVYDAASSRAIIDAAVKNNAPRPNPDVRIDAPTSGKHVWLPQSIICSKGDQFKSFNVAWGTEPGDLKCAVVISENDKVLDDAPWYARKEVDFCPRKIQESADPLLKAGWSCKGR